MNAVIERCFLLFALLIGVTLTGCAEEGVGTLMVLSQDSLTCVVSSHVSGGDFHTHSADRSRLLGLILVGLGLIVGSRT